jgi:hypothetical protein
MSGIIFVLDKEVAFIVDGEAILRSGGHGEPLNVKHDPSQERL